MTDAAPSPQEAARRAFATGREVRWCPGCGNYSILTQLQRTLAELGTPREKIVFISGIGCSSRLPYYMNTYGFHTIHGRAPAVATGLRIVNPELQIWLVTGDGDGLSIGGNHLMHLLRRNMDVKVLLVNNRIYGLTKGQASPTTPLGTKTKTTPQGAIVNPVEPLRFAVASKAGFVARAIDVFPAHLGQMLRRAAAHKGAAFVEIYQNCVVFNDGAFAHFTGKDVRPERIIELEHGKPMRFGKDLSKGLAFRKNTAHIEVVAADDPNVIVHDETLYDSTMTYALARLRYPDYPIPIGVYRDVSERTYGITFEEALEQKVRESKASRPVDLRQLLLGDHAWTVTPPPRA